MIIGYSCDIFQAIFPFVTKICLSEDAHECSSTPHLPPFFSSRTAKSAKASTTAKQAIGTIYAV